MTIGTTTETDAEVAAKLIAAKPRPARCRWTCKRCGNPQDAEERPPSPQLCARCRSIVLDMHTEPATRPVYGDESEDDGLPIVLPPAKTPGLPERVWVVPEFNNPAPSAPAEEKPVTATATKEPPKAAEKKPESNCARCGNPPTPVGRKQTRTLVHVDGQEVCGKCMNKIVAARQREAGIKPRPTAKAEPKPLVTFACDRCGRKDFPGERERNGHLAWCGKKRGAELRASDLVGVGKPGSVTDRASKGDAAALAELNRPEPWTEPRASRPVTVRHRGAGLEIECATVEDAAAFVRLVGATTGAGTEARG